MLENVIPPNFCNPFKDLTVTLVQSIFIIITKYRWQRTNFKIYPLALHTLGTGNMGNGCT